MKLIAGNSNLPLATAVATTLKTSLAAAHIQRFPDQEIFVDIKDGVRGDDVYVIQSTSHPTNDHLMELFIIIDALKRSSARRITAVIPYFGYARQDRKSSPRTSISAKLVANLLVTAGAHRVMTFDLHARQIQGFFDIPLDHLDASPLFAADIQARHTDFIVVSPDIGGVVRARELADRLDAPIAIVEKRRQDSGSVSVHGIIGDVREKYCVLVDDIVDSAGTLCKAATALMDAGARGVCAYVTHGVLSEPALTHITASPLETLTLTDTINAQAKLEICPKISVLSVTPLLAEAIHRMSTDKSVSGLFW